MKNNKFPECCAIWRIEFQKRGALHVHMIVFGKDWLFSEVYICVPARRTDAQYGS